MELLSKRLIWIVLVVLLSTSCGSYLPSKPYFDYQGNHPRSGIDRFRFDVCFSILASIYKETNAIAEMGIKDSFIHPSDYFWPPNYGDIIDSIGQAFIYNSPRIKFLRELESGSKEVKDFFYLEKDRPDFYKDDYLRAVLNFYESRELDSLARHYLNISDKEYKKALKRNYKLYLKSRHYDPYSAKK